MSQTFAAFFETLGMHVLFFSQIIKATFKERFEGREFIFQIAHIGWRSLPTTLTAGVFTGAILAMQFYMQLKNFGAEGTLGGLNTSGTLREVGPILIAFMLAGKVGAFTSAELGTMKVTDQIDAIRCLGINPLAFLVVPRFYAVVFCSVLLLAFGLVISVTGGVLAAYAIADMHPYHYLSTIERFATTQAITLAISKSIVFGIFMGHLCCANGYTASGGSEGVGLAVKKTAVQSMVCIVIADFCVTWIVSSIL